MRRSAILYAASLLAFGAMLTTAKPGLAATSTATDAVDVTLGEYAFIISGTLKTGGTIRYRNIGREAHMARFVRLKPGKTLEQVKAAIASNDEKAIGLVADQVSLPAALVTPGNSVDITVPTLTAGNYALLCFIPAEPNGPPHFMKGMVGQLTVEASKAKAPKNDATYTVTPGKGLSGPTTLKAGRHSLAVNVGSGGEELELLLLPAPSGVSVAAIKKQVDAMFAGADKGVYPKGSGEKMAKLIVFGASDFKKDRKVSFGVDLKPGSYIMAAVDTDIDKLPNPLLEQIAIKVT